jgi:hypothetical protein
MQLPPSQEDIERWKAQVDERKKELQEQNGNIMVEAWK